MARVKRAVHAKKHHRAVLEQAQGYYGNKSRSFRAANEQVMHSMQYAYRDRRARKGDFRQLWIQRINAAARLNGSTYSRLIAGLHRADVDVDRKVLADLAVSEPEAFAVLGAGGQRRAGQRHGQCRGRFLTQHQLASTHHRVRRVRQLLRKRSLRASERALVVEGAELLAAAIQSGLPIESVYVAPEGHGVPSVTEVVEQGFAVGARVFDLAPGVLERVSDTVTPQPVVAVVGFLPGTLADLEDPSLVVVCVDVRDPGNAGTMIRTSDAAGVDAVVCCDGTVDPTNPKTVRASAGSLFHLPVLAGG